MTDAPDPVTVGSNLTYSLTVTNLGPAMAASVTVTDALPASVTFLSASVSQGTWATNGGSLFTCALGNINANGSATVSIVVRPNSAGSISNTATVSSSISDPNIANNTAIAVTAANVAPPTITQPPQPQNVCPGATATFTVAAAGAGPLSYQWQTNNINLTNGGHYGGVTTSNLIVSGADSTVLGNYRCVVSNQGGSTPSSTAALTISDTTPPTIICPAAVTVSANAGCSATNVALGSPVTGDNCGVAGVTNNGLASYPAGNQCGDMDGDGHQREHQQLPAAGDRAGQPGANDRVAYDQRGGGGGHELPGLHAGYHGHKLYPRGGQLQFRDGDAERGDHTVLSLGTNEVVLGAFDMPAMWLIAPTTSWWRTRRRLRSRARRT